jgi:hypothetical protein
MSTIKTDNLQNAAGSLSVPVATVVNGSAKAWVNFNGTFTTSPFTVANGGIRAAFNVSSITDNSVGGYSVNFINAMPDANYAAHGFSITQPSGVAWVSGAAAVSNTATQASFQFISNAGAFDPAAACVTIFR